MSKSSKAYVGMDVHKESIDWAIAEGRRGALSDRSVGT